MSAKSDNDNHSNQLNPNNDEYWNSRDAGGRTLIMPIMMMMFPLSGHCHRIVRPR